MTARSVSGKFLYRSVTQAFSSLNMKIDESDAESALVWHDSIKDSDYFSPLRPWQVVNRLPMVNLICRKAPFARTVERIGRFFPHDYNFVPKSFILPHTNRMFSQVARNSKRRYIIKPDGGALGNGIRFVDPVTPFIQSDKLAVAQEYVESADLDGYKFDFRIYVLVLSAKPVKAYVYRDGIVRFCSETTDGKTPFSTLTNTAVNIRNPEATAVKITKTITGITPELRKKGVDVTKMWKEIDRIVALTLISVSEFIAHRASIDCPNPGYSRSFQLLGFDVMLDKNWKPWILEVNYRPSLQSGTRDETALKVELLKQVVSIAAPLDVIENVVRENKSWDYAAWCSYLEQNSDVLDRISTQRRRAVSQSKFVKVLPAKGERVAEWSNILRVLDQMPREVNDAYRLPRLVPYFPPQQLLQARPAPPIVDATVRSKGKIAKPSAMRAKIP